MRNIIDKLILFCLITKNSTGSRTPDIALLILAQIKYHIINKRSAVFACFKIIKVVAIKPAKPIKCTHPNLATAVFQNTIGVVGT